MPVRHGYNLVEETAADLRVPLYDEEAFRQGITFHSKYVGSLNVPRPSSRVEIVAAMRRIRNEFKAKCIKKKKVSIVVSVDGVKVVLWKNQKRKECMGDDTKLLVMHDPIYRIFYVSHDSRELRVFSYIARDGSGSTFRCNVFKSKKKMQSVRIVRTLGQAFEVSHQLSQQQLRKSPGSEEELPGCQLAGAEECLEDANKRTPLAERLCDQPAGEDSGRLELDVLTSGYVLEARDSKEWEKFLLSMDGPQQDLSLTSSQAAQLPPLAAQHHLQLLQQQLQQQQLQTQVAVSQAQLLKEQLAAEIYARSEAQAQVSELLLQNKDLLQHVALLLQLLKDLEAKAHGAIHSRESSPWGPVLSLSLRNSHSLDRDQPLDCSPGSRPEKASAATVLENCAESCFSLLSLGSEANLEAPEDDRALVATEVTEQVEESDDSGRQIKIDTWAVQRVTEWFQHTVPKLNAPPPASGRKQADKMWFLAHPHSVCNVAASLPQAEPCDTHSLGNSENESWSTSEDSGVRCEKLPLSPSHQGTPEAQGPCLSVFSSFSSQQEDFDGFSSTSTPLLPSCTVVAPDSFEFPFTSSSLTSGI